MKNVGLEVNRILLEKNIKKKDFAAKLEMTPVNLSKIIKKASVDASLLEKISDMLDVPISYFFDEVSRNMKNGKGNKNNEQLITSLCKEIEKLKDKITKLQDIALKDKETIINLLKNK